MNKIVLKQCHDNTHSVSRILRNIKLIKQDNIDSSIEKRLNFIEEAALQCKNQVDVLYNEFKKLENE